MPVTHKYRVLAGRHVDEDGESYEAGEVVESKHELDKMFDNKFQRVEGFEGNDDDGELQVDEKQDISPANAPSMASRTPTEDNLQTTDKPERGIRDEEGIRKAMAERKAEEDEAAAGIEERATKNVKGKGQVFVAQAPKKAAVVTVSGKKPLTDKVPDDDEEDDEDEVPKKTTRQREQEAIEEESEFGVDVTDRFDTAEEGGFQVFKGSSGFTVVSSAEPTTALQDPVRSKADVESFLEERAKKAKKAKK